MAITNYEKVTWLSVIPSDDIVSVTPQYVINIPQTVNFALTSLNGYIRSNVAFTSGIPTISVGDKIVLQPAFSARPDTGTPTPKFVFTDGSEVTAKIVYEVGIDGNGKLTLTSLNSNLGVLSNGVIPTASTGFDTYNSMINRLYSDLDLQYNNISSDKVGQAVILDNISTATFIVPEEQKIKILSCGAGYCQFPTFGFDFNYNLLYYIAVTDSDPTLLEDGSNDLFTRNCTNDLKLDLGVEYDLASLFTNADVGAEIIIRVQVVKEGENDTYKTLHNENGTSYSVGDDNFRLGQYFSGPRGLDRTRYIVDDWAVYDFTLWKDAIFDFGGGDTLEGWSPFITNTVTGGVSIMSQGAQRMFHIFRRVTPFALSDGSRSFYVDIGENVSFGSGTPSDPYNLIQFNDKIKNDLQDNDKYYVKGRYNNQSSSWWLEELYQSYSDINITIQGWDIDIHGSPIVVWDTSGQTSLFGNIDFGVNITFKDFIFASYGSDLSISKDLVNIFTFKDVLFISNNLIDGGASHGEVPIYDYRKLKFYGCTFNTGDINLTNNNEIVCYDCVFDTPSLDFSDIYTLVMENNLTNLDNFTSYINNVFDITGYTVPLHSIDIISTPIISDFDTFVSYYTDSALMYYDNFGIYVSNSPIIQGFRLSNGYNNGLFGNTRVAYGAYSFVGDASVDEEDFSTSGHIGAFYFGGEYSNGDVTIDDSFLTLEPSSNAGVIDADFSIKDKCSIKLDIPDVVAEGQRNFLIDFVAKRVDNDTYPKFCGLKGTGVGCDQCTTDDDERIYNEQITGGNPVVVDFSACAEAVMQYSQYEPIRYRWWFDYEHYNSPEDAVITTEPYAQHTYCGGYLEDYDVRLCVEFAGVKYNN